MKRAAGADVPAVCFLRETLKMGRGLFDAYSRTSLWNGTAHISERRCKRCVPFSLQYKCRSTASIRRWKRHRRNKETRRMAEQLCWSALEFWQYSTGYMEKSTEGKDRCISFAVPWAWRCLCTVIWESKERKARIHTCLPKQMATRHLRYAENKMSEMPEPPLCCSGR